MFGFPDIWGDQYRNLLCSNVGSRMHRIWLQVVGVSLILNLAFGLIRWCHFTLWSLLSCCPCGASFRTDGIWVSYYCGMVGHSFSHSICCSFLRLCQANNSLSHDAVTSSCEIFWNIIGNWSRWSFGKFGMPKLWEWPAASFYAYLRGIYGDTFVILST